MSVVLSEHLPLLATAPDGIQKLRGLILELAVRGKLVPQDPKDEAASELLNRIAKERARLEAEGIRKKSKPMPLVGEDEQHFAPPLGWEWSRFSAYALEVSTGPFGSMLHKSDYRDGGIPLVNPSHMIGGRIVPESHIAVDELKANELSSYRLNCGDIVMARRGEVGRTALVTDEEDGWLCGTGSFVIRLAQDVSRAYVVVLFRASSIRRYLGEEAVGTTMVNLNHGILNSMPVALPPLAEQHRIVAKVDELMAICDRLEAEQTDAERAHARLVDTLLGALTQSANTADLAANWQRLAEHFDTLFTTESTLDALKQTILQLAVMGKLVPQDPNDEPANELLTRIAKERARLVAEGVRKKSMSTPLVDEDAQSFALPDGWAWVRVDEISQFVTDGEHATPTRTCDRTAIPLVTAKNVRDGFLDYTHTDFVPKEVAEKCWKRCKPTQGDILLVSVGATLGRLSVLDHDRDMVLVRSVTVIRPCLVDRDFFATALRSPILQSCIWSGVKQSAQPCLYLAQSSSLPIPLPPLSEQHRIVAKVNELIALCDRLKADLAESRTRQARLSATLIETALQAA